MNSTKTITLEVLAEKLKGKLWTKGDLKRIYLDAGYNTKKMSTKTYVFQREDGTFGVSCYIECPSQNYNWIKSQQDEVIAGVERSIEKALSETVYIVTNAEGKIVDFKGEEVALNWADSYLIRSEFEDEHFITMPRDEFEAEVARLESIEAAKPKPVIVEEKKQVAITSTKTTTLVGVVYEVGKRYFHANYGEGVVTASENGIITFNSVINGEKKMIEKYVKMEAL